MIIGKFAKYIELMQKVNPNKALGQHFLKDSAVIERIVGLIDQAYAHEALIEIGPGTGALTKSLLPKYGNIIQCIEVDTRCVEYLERHYSILKGKIFQADFLSMNLNPILGENATIVGNFPYNISSQIVFTIIDHHAFIPSMVGMFQKEVALRIAGTPGGKDYGILSIMTQLYYDAEVNFHISPDAFDPPPKVMSSVITLKRRKDIPSDFSHALFKKVVKAAFNQRRKMLRNALSGLVDPALLQNDFFQQRAERLNVEDYIRITKAIETGNF
jgi:16S rRNA (adenine1518-N6/adenine1519-N6)-dimethyltransferase